MDGASTRRKACSHCIKAKRRCDQAVPSCSRCSRQKLCCQYSSHSLPSTSRSIIELAEPQATASSVQDVLDDTLDIDLFTPGNQMTSCNDLSRFHSELDAANVTLDLSPMEEFAFSNVMSNLTQTNSPHELMLTRPLDISSSVNYDQMKSKMDFSMKHFKRAPWTMIQENQTPWSHHLLYDEQMPKAMQDAYAACALCMAKNETNSKFVFRHIDECVQDLIATPMPTTLSDILARTHALFLYQIMRIFHGSISEFAQAELSMPHLESCGLALHKAVSTYNPVSEPTSFYPITLTKPFWRDWILVESAGRSVIATFQLLCAHSFVMNKSSYCASCGPFSTSWTASAKLWNASSAFDFAVQWKDTKTIVVKDLDFSMLLENGRPEDFDTFSKMMIVPFLGIDDARGWFYTKGGCLDE